MNRFCIEEDEPNELIFPHDFQFLNQILQVISKSNKRLSLDGYPESFGGRRVFANFIHKSLLLNIFLKKKHFSIFLDLKSVHFVNKCVLYVVLLLQMAK